jgi:hypothetical protein
MESTQVDAVGTEIRPFEVDVPQADLDELRRRIRRPAGPRRRQVADQSQGVQSATMQELVLPGHRVRLPEVRGEAERAASIHHGD